MKIRLVWITLLAILLSTPIYAGPVSLNNANAKVKKVSPKLNKVVADKENIPITVEKGEIEIVTDLAGNHYWQIGVTNTSNRDANNFKVYVDVAGFRQEDRVPTVGTIERLEAGKTAFARAKLPDFEGMHQFRIKDGGNTKVVEIPRPYRKDANGNPAAALKIEKVWAMTVGGKIRWYMKTMPNIYGTIPPRKLLFKVQFRERKKKYCHQEAFKKIGYLDHQQLISYIAPETNHMVTNQAAIAPGGSMTFSGEMNASTANPHVPDKVDRLTIEFPGGDRKSVPLPESFYAPYLRCTDE